MLVVWGVTALLALVVLGSVLFVVVGSLRRLGRELQAAEREVRPLLEQAQATGARAAALPSGEQRRNEG